MNCDKCSFRLTKTRKPMSLPCGHSLCSECIGTGPQVKCFKCGQVGKPVLNHGLYQVVQQLRNQTTDKYLKVCCFGQSEVGKTSLIYSLGGEPFRACQQPTIGFDMKVIQRKVNGKNISYQLWDSAGQERYRAITPSHYKDADIIIIVYSLQNSPQANCLQYWIDQVTLFSQTNNIIIVGNKLDLVEEKSQITPISDQCMMTIKENKWKMIETSCRDSTNINQLSRILMEFSTLPQSQKLSRSSFQIRSVLEPQQKNCLKMLTGQLKSWFSKG